jgi:hypothetical protein
MAPPAPGRVSSSAALFGVVRSLVQSPPILRQGRRPVSVSPPARSDGAPPPGGHDGKDALLTPPGPFLNQLLIEPLYSAVGHSGRVCWLTASSKRACVPMALDPEEIVTLLLLAALAIAWNWRLGH